MVLSGGKMKRKRKDDCPSPFLDESPKRTKVHAQRKFAQGSNVNSPVITPVKEIEMQEMIDVLPEPVELLPIKRPNTEDFLTFLCFRGTPILPPALNFFNTASIVDTNGQVHEIKSESPKNGPLDTSAIIKSGSSLSERPFIAFGVRKRADPIVISRQMDKKRRHALALQALRRKYQEQRMAKIRAVTISKLSEKVTSKTVLRSSSVTKTETVTSKKANVVQKPKEISETTNIEKITTRSAKTTLRPQIKQKMCLRSFRGRFVQRELQFRNLKKKSLSIKTISKNQESKKRICEERESDISEYSSEDEKPLKKSCEKKKSEKVKTQSLPKKTVAVKKPLEISFRITRSHKFFNNKIVSRRQLKQRMIMSTPKQIVKPRTLRSQTIQTRLMSEVKQKLLANKLASTSQTRERFNHNTLKKLSRCYPPNKNYSNVTPKSNSTKKTVKTSDSLKDIIKINESTNSKSDIGKKVKSTGKTTPQNDEKVTKSKTSPPQLKKAKSSERSDSTVSSEAQKKINESENSEARMSQRPTRKTKEAAAIYMEILSHKLVNEGKVDDDNVSIDSFPELPNVKKTEQRENELKAKAKNVKSNESDNTGSTKLLKSKEADKVLRSTEKKKVEKSEEQKTIKTEIDETVVEENEKSKKQNEDQKKIITKQECDRKTRSSQQKDTVKVPEGELKKEPEIETNIRKNKQGLKERLSKTRAIDRVILNLDLSDTDSFSETSRDVNKSSEMGSTRRQTRNSSQNVKSIASDDSDESFRVDIRIPRKKQITRSKCKAQESENENSEKCERMKTKSYKENSSESDYSTTSDVDVPLKNRNTKCRKIKKQLMDEQSFSESDEEPLSKLTQNKLPPSKLSLLPPSKIELMLREKYKRPPIVIEWRNRKDSEKAGPSKPKRECAKRALNYLSMFSSSDDEDLYFRGFQLKSDNAPTKVSESLCSHVPTSDLSCKDIGRRFGKGKVNMSTEQIEKWLKDSAMAGSSVMKENDSMLKFGEKIPPDPPAPLEINKLRDWFLSDKTPEHLVKKEDIKEICIKPVQSDRKLIFKTKEKSLNSSIVSPFSVSNENSVYAFGEETEDVMKTPFRRPSRRPSSTATSRSEDESSKHEDFSKTVLGQFRKPPSLKQDMSKSKESIHIDECSEEKTTISSSDEYSFYMPAHSPNLAKSGVQKVDKSKSSFASMILPLSSQKSNIGKQVKASTRNLEGDDFKYKVPSSPSASSSSSAKLYKRQNSKPKLRTAEVLPVKLPEFPSEGVCAQLVEAPTFQPTEKEFQDPLEYIEKIRARAEQFGICRIIPPSTFKPECKVTDDMRFTAYNQYVHKMLHRWGPNFKELMAIKKYLSTQNISLTHSPWIGGMEIDLPRLYQIVQSLGGLKEVIEKKKWPKVSDIMKIPKCAQDRVTKLDDIYCKYLLPYDTLSPGEREKLFDEVETEWAKRESKSLLKAQKDVDFSQTEDESESDDEAEECTIKGRSMALNAFYRIARNTMSMWFKNSEPSPEEVEQEFWKNVTLRENHICVHSGSIDSGNWGYGFAVSKNSPFARHAWNLKVLTNNSGSILRSMGPVMGVTVPTLHVGMVFSSGCWYRDPHSLPWIEYLHTGGSKIWYGIPDSASGSFHTALKSLVPNYCRNKSLWLPSDTVMVPPSLLVENKVSLSRIVQEPGQFIVVFPKVFTSSLSTGYVVSESVYFAPSDWLRTSKTVFEELRNSCEPPMFSFERLLLSIVNDTRSNIEVLKQIIPAVKEFCDKEKIGREKIKNLGVNTTEKLPPPDGPQARKKKKFHNQDGDYECEICRMNLFVSVVLVSQDDSVYCLDHAAEQIEKKQVQSKHCKLMYTYDEEELNGLVNKIETAIANKFQRKIPNKYAGMPTLLTK